MSDKVETDVNATVLAILVSAGDDIRLGESARRRAEDKIENGAYNTIMLAAVESGTWDIFEAAIKMLFVSIRTNEITEGEPKGMAVKFGAEANEKGDGYTVPHSLSRAKTVVKKAFSNGVNLTNEDGEARSFGSVRDENKAIRIAAQAAAEAEESTVELTGEALTRAECGQALSLIQAAVTTATGQELADLATVLLDLAGMADAPEVSDEDAGEQLANVA